MYSRYDYRLLAIGVDHARGQGPLRYAEADARRISRIFTGGLGPIHNEESARCMLGGSATLDAVLIRLALLARTPPQYLLIYFAGHGNDDGIALADGMLSYQFIADALGGIRSRAKTIILQTCHAGSGLAILREKLGAVGGVETRTEWAHALANACPGLRVFAAVASTGLAYEDSAVQGGRFTFGLLRALRFGAPDMQLQAGGPYWISDRRAFEVARVVVGQTWAGESLPEFHSPPACARPLPMALAQRTTVIGQAAIAQTAPYGLDLGVAVATSGRRHVPTHVRGQLIDERGELMCESVASFEPRGWDDVSNVVLTPDRRALILDLWRRRESRTRGRVWRLDILDDFGWMLDSHVVRASRLSMPALSPIGPY